MADELRRGLDRLGGEAVNFRGRVYRCGLFGHDGGGLVVVGFLCLGDRDRGDRFRLETALDAECPDQRLVDFLEFGFFDNFRFRTRRRCNVRQCRGKLLKVFVTDCLLCLVGGFGFLLTGIFAFGLSIALLFATPFRGAAGAVEVA